MLPILINNKLTVIYDKKHVFLLENCFFFGMIKNNSIPCTKTPVSRPSPAQGLFSISRTSSLAWRIAVRVNLRGESVYLICVLHRRVDYQIGDFCTWTEHRKKLFELFVLDLQECCI